MVKVKICGFTTREDIEYALSLGIEIIGINFWQETPRYVSLEKAKKLLDNLPAGVMSIGVFVNPDEEVLFNILDKLNLSGVQLHGEEPPAFISRIKRQFPDRVIIKALRAENKDVLQLGLRKYSPDFFLLDAFKKNIPGGTGIGIDRTILRQSCLPWEKIFLAGGITPENVREILKEFNPYGIDVASGGESSPGKKDREKMRKLVENLK